MKEKSFALGHYQIASWFTVWAIFTFVNATGANVYRNAICEYYGVSDAPLLDGATYGGWIGGIVFLIMPMMIKKFGAKKVLLTAIIAGGIAFALIPLSSNVIYLQIGILLCGVFAGIYGVSTPMVLVSKWFPKKKGTIMGIVSAGSIGASMVILPVFNLILQRTNIVTAMMAVGIFMILYGVLNIFFMKETPEECGLYPDNKKTLADEKFDPEGGSTPNLSYSEALKQPKLWFIAAGWGLMLVALLGLTFIAVSYMLERGVSNSTAILAVSVCGVIQFFVSLLSGMIDQRFGPVKTALFFFVFQVSGILIVIFYHGASSMIVIGGYWLVVGTFGTANNLASSQNLSVFGSANYPLTYNCQCFANSIIKMMGTFIAARSLIWAGDYSLAYYAFGLALILGIICIILGGDKSLGRKLKGGGHEQTSFGTV